MRDEIRVIHPGQNEVRRSARGGEFQDLADHLADAFDLLPDRGHGRLPHAGHVAHARHLRGQADNIQRVFQIVDDGTRKPAHHRQPLRLDNLLEVLPVKLPQPGADLPQQGEGQRGRSLNELQRLRPREKPKHGLHPREGARRPRLFLEHGHLSEKIARLDLRKDMGRVRIHPDGDLDQALLHHVDALAGVAFLEDDDPGACTRAPGRPGLPPAERHGPPAERAWSLRVS